MKSLQTLNQHLANASADVLGSSFIQPRGHFSFFKILLPLMQIVIFFAVVVFVIYLVRYLIQTKFKHRAKTHCITILESHPLSKGQALHLIDIGGRILLVGSSHQALSLLTEITDKETKTQILQNASQNQGFQHYLSQFKF